MKTKIIAIVVLISIYSNGQSFDWVSPFGASNLQSSTMDDQGNVYSCGRFGGTVDFDSGVGIESLTHVGNTPDLYVTKHDSDGNLIWAKQISSTEYLDVGYNSIEVKNGYLYIAGGFSDENSDGVIESPDFDPSTAVFAFPDAFVNDGTSSFICKWDLNGNFIWVKEFKCDYFGGLTPVLSVDDNDNVLVAQNFREWIDFEPQNGSNIVNNGDCQYSLAFMKFDQSGNFIWGKILNGFNGSFGAGPAFSVKCNGQDVYLTSTFSGDYSLEPGGQIPTNSSAAGGLDAYVAKYDENGVLMWSEIFAADNGIFLNDIHIANNGTIYGGGRYFSQMYTDVGNFTPLPGSSTAYYFSLSNQGTLNWVKIYGGTGIATVSDVSSDNFNSLYIGGTINEGDVDFDYSGSGHVIGLTGSQVGRAYVMRINSNGSFSSVFTIDPVESSNVRNVNLYNNGDISIRGFYRGATDFDPGTGTQFVDMVGSEYNSQYVARINQVDAGVNELDIDGLVDVFPNPTESGEFTVEVEGGIQSIEVMDMTGRAIELPMNVSEGTIDGTMLSSGKYIVRVTTMDDKTIQGTIVVQK